MGVIAFAAKKPAVPPPPGIDQYTKLMLHMDDVGLTDSSLNPHTVSINGNVVRSDTQSKFSGYSAYFDGTDDWLTVPDSPDFDFNNGNFTIDFWVYTTNIPNVWQTFIGQYNNTSGCWAVYTGTSPGGAAGAKISMNFQYSVWGDYRVAQTDTYNLNEWTHGAIVRENTTTIKLYVNGVLKDTETVPASMAVENNIPGGLRIGHQQSGPSGYGFYGYMDELRISKGIARWTTDFDPPTSPYST